MTKVLNTVKIRKVKLFFRCIFLRPQEIKEKLKSLIEEASTIDPRLAIRLNQINRWIKDVKPGSLTAKKFVLFLLQQIIIDARTYLDIKSLSDEDKRQQYYQEMNPCQRYWYSYLFPKWLEEKDPDFETWKKKLMAGEFEQSDTQVLTAVAKEIKQRGQDLWQSYIADVAMATDIIVSNELQHPLCVQLTSLSDVNSQSKFTKWENKLIYWGIERGLFLSYNPGIDGFIKQIVNVSLENSDNLPIGVYLKFNL